MTRNSDSVRSDMLDNRDRILAAANDVLADRGERAEVREVAARAGVGVGTLYRHFGDRGGLLIAALEEASRRTLERVREAAAEANPRTALRAVVGVFAEEYERSGALFAIARHEQLPEDSAVADDLRQTLETVVDLFEQGRLLGTFRADLDAQLMTDVLVAAMDVFAGPAKGRPQALADILLDGVCR